MEAIRLVLCVLSSVAIHTEEKLGRRTSVLGYILVYILVLWIFISTDVVPAEQPSTNTLVGAGAAGLAVGNIQKALQGEGNSDHPWFHTNYLTAKDTSPRR